MIRVATISEVREAVDRARSAGSSIGLVPTMGALHDGHVSLVRHAVAAGDFVAMSVFVNPLQFGPDEDLGRYPRTLESDCELAEAAGCSLVFHPDASEMYPAGVPLTTVSVDEISIPLEGRGRPGHFDGVATVVAKLLAIFEPDSAYFGQKDAQQLALAARMAADLSFRAEIVACPTLREPDGLAMSSRNAYLDAGDRAAAPTIFAALMAAAEFVRNGEREHRIIAEKLESVLASEPRLDVEYAAVRDARTFKELPENEPLAGDVILAVAARTGPPGSSTRLIDNVIIHIDPAQHPQKGADVTVNAGEIKGEP